jgi:ribosomal protein S18 acetylase RimI-like enzyme
MDVQFYSPEHFESVVDLLCEMSVLYNGSNASDRDVVSENLKQTILGPDSGVKVVVAVDHRRVVGMACISLLYPAPKERGQLFMKELYVVGDRRRNGIGLELMRFVAAYAVRKACSRFDWTVDETNPMALAFYHELGATQIDSKVYFRFADKDLLTFASGTSLLLK